MITIRERRLKKGKMLINLLLMFPPISAGLGEWFRNARPAEALKDDKLSFIVSQGTCLDRSGRLFIKQEDDGNIWVGGRTLVCVKGSVLLP